MQHESTDTLAYAQPQLYIDGRWLDAGDRVTEEVLNPATGQALARLPHATRADLDEALGAARRAFPGWRAAAPRASKPPADRGRARGGVAHRRAFPVYPAAKASIGKLRERRVRFSSSI